MESINYTPILLLRKYNDDFKIKQKHLKKRIKSKKYLKQQIYSNKNIFSSNVNLYKNMTAQNIIWQKNYRFKCVINQIKQENSSLKAKIWNYQKQNRKMQRQIQLWNLNQQTTNSITKKPYIDMATVQKVFGDQDYNIVSLKIQISQLQNEYYEQDRILQQFQQKINENSVLVNLLNHEINKKKIDLFQYVQDNLKSKNKNEQQVKQYLANKIMQKSQQLDIIHKNTQLKKKSIKAIKNQLQNFFKSCEDHKDINFEQIERLNYQSRKMKYQEDQQLIEAKQKLKHSKRQLLQFQCYVHEQMGKYIKQKIPIRNQIQRLMDQIQQIDKITKSKKSRGISIRK